MKNLNLILFIILQLSTTLNAQESRFKEGETINVWAESGLNMRDKPDAKAQKLMTIPFGAKVTVQANIGIKIPFQVEIFKGFDVKGFWLLVKYNNTEGFVFDGFLSRLPTPIVKTKKSKNISQSDLLESYLNEYIGKVGKKYDVRIHDKSDGSSEERFGRALKPNEKYDEDDVRVQIYKQKYNNNIIYETNLEVTLPDCTLFEGYLLVKRYLYDPKRKDIITINDGIYGGGKDEEEGFMYYFVKQVENSITISGRYSVCW
jgi:Bacterial SH3 domain